MRLEGDRQQKRKASPQKLSVVTYSWGFFKNGDYFIFTFYWYAMVYFLSNLRLYEKKVYIVFLINIRNGDVFHTWLNIRHKEG